MGAKKPRQLKTLIDTRKLLSRCIVDFLERKMDDQRLRSIVSACGMLGTLIKDSTLEDRITRLEKAAEKEEAI